MRRILPILIGVLIIAVIGVAGYYIYRTFFGGRGTLTVWTLPGNESAVQLVAKEFTRQNPSYKIRIVPISEQVFEFKSLYALASQKGPEIWIMPNEWMALHNSKLVPAPDGVLDKAIQSYERKRTNGETPPPKPAKNRSNKQIIEDDYGPIVQNDVLRDDKVYGVPLNMDTLALFYDKTKINVPPATWRDVVDLTKRFTQRSGASISRSTIALGERESIDHYLDILSILMMQNGAKMVNPEEEIATFNTMDAPGTPPGAIALDFYTSFAKSDKETYTWNNALGNGIDALKNGRTMMAIGYLNDLDRIGPVGESNFAIAPLPQVKKDEPLTYGRYLTATVTKQADTEEKQKAAWNFISLFANPDLTEAYANELRTVPARIDVAKRLNLGPQYRTYLDQVAYATNWQKVEVTEADGALDEALVLNMDKGNNAQVALDVAAKAYTSFLQRETGIETDPNVLSLWQSEDDPTDYRETTRILLSQNKEIKRVAISKHDPERYEWEIINTMASRLGPDILLLPNDHVQRLVELLRPFPNRAFNFSPQRINDQTAWEKTFVPAVLTDNVIDGRMYGVPAHLETLALAYNQDLFRELEKEKSIERDEDFRQNDDLFGIGPLLWDDLKTMARIATKRNGANLDLPFVAFGTGDNVEHSADLFAVLVKQFGGEVTEPDRQRTGINLPFSSRDRTVAGEEAEKLIESFANPSNDYYTWNTDQPNSIEALGKSEVMAAFLYPRDIPKVLEYNPKLNIKFFPLPQIAENADAVDIASYYSLVLPKSGKRPNDAIDFIVKAVETRFDDFVSPKKTADEFQVIERPSLGNPQRMQRNTAQSYYKGLYPIDVDRAIVQVLDNRLTLDQAAQKINQLLKQPIL